MEKRELEEKLQAELDEMKAQLKLFQKVHDLSSTENLKIMTYKYEIYTLRRKNAICRFHLGRFMDQ